MFGYLQKIKTKIPYSTKEVDINVDGKTLILTGGNGCGKTQLIELIFQKLTDSVVKRNNHNLAELQNQLRLYQIEVSKIGPARQQYNDYIATIETLKIQIEETENPPLIIENIDDFVVKHQNFKAILTQFNAMRKSNISKPSSVTSLDTLRKQERESATYSHIQYCAADVFEEFLVTNIANQAFSESEKINNNPEEAQRIARWFKKLETDLQDLFEDDQLSLKFKSDSFSFEIHQPTKDPYTFQTLSSGFSSIMSVYADLITKVSLRTVEPNDLTGIVLIDEIDAHLHVSLQKKILAFLKKAFPKVQFIVSTHSPFVVSSIEDAVIYDLSKLQQVEDLSMYSYEAVLEGLFGVIPISTLLQDRIENLSELLKQSPINTTKIEAVLNQLPNDENALDQESLYFVKSAQIAISKAKRLLDV